MSWRPTGGPSGRSPLSWSESRAPSAARRRVGSSHATDRSGRRGGSVLLVPASGPSHDELMAPVQRRQQRERSEQHDRGVEAVFTGGHGYGQDGHADDAEGD